MSKRLGDHHKICFPYRHQAHEETLNSFISRQIQIKITMEYYFTCRKTDKKYE